MNLIHCVFVFQSTSAVLMENMDMYMLNPCNNKIWSADLQTFSYI